MAASMLPNARRLAIRIERSIYVRMDFWRPARRTAQRVQNISHSGEGMTQTYKETRQIDALLEFYADDIRQTLKSGLTGAELPPPATRYGQAQWLSLCLYKPQVGLVWGSDIAFSQLDMYLPYLRRSKKRFAIFAKSLKGKQIEAVKAQAPTFVVSPDFVPRLALPSVPSLSTLLFITDKAENFNYIRGNPQCIHVFAGHGESDKHSSNSRLVRAYDFVFVANQNSVERFQRAGIDLNPNRFLVTGGAPIEGVEPAPVSGPFRKILYAPTWEGHGVDRNYSSAGKISDALQTYTRQGGKLRFRPHPGMGTKLTSMKAIKELFVSLLAGEKTKKAGDFNWSDVLISDISGVVAEYLFTNKPIIIPVGPKGDWLRDYIEATPLQKYAYLWPYTEMNLQEMLDSIANDPMKEARLEYRNSLYYGAEDIDQLCAMFEQAIELCMAQHRQLTLRSPRYFAASRESVTWFNTLPEDEELQRIVKGIKAGKLILAP
ncbi:hypothetical protein J2Y48_002909 [Mycoplana sp. BE70]|uniref:CDP-glycerol glycerophosphotransferase family protein n=1 Tax=Mycoplana sp. BE70 TaxID=2817775 RepID=UPI00285FAD9F|nr:CDP-glycerol glycerophosphotransferase family protein [Mycoplana sp. BE70]MDR6757612.1 hypothetical protein [Mycoplana sp. BE70]